MDQEQQIGYLIAKVEEIAEDQKKTALKVEELELLVIKKLTTAETVFRTLKASIVVVMAVLAFKWGDIPGLWKSIVG